MLRNSPYLLFQVRGTTPELLGISVTSDGSCMSPYRDYDLRSERKMRASVGRTASFMSTSTGSRPQPLGKNWYHFYNIVLIEIQTSNGSRPKYTLIGH